MKRYILLAALFVAGNFAQAQEEKPVFDVVVNNETSINTDQLEFSPSFFEDGILFISSRENVFKFVDRRMRRNTMGIFLARRNSEGTLGSPTFFSDRINTKYHEGPLTFDMSGSDMYFTRSNYINGKLGKSKDGWVNLRVLKATKSGDKWDDVKDLPFNSDDFNVCHPSLSPEGDRLYFASDMPGGFGGLDIYYVTKMGDDYGDPINLGAEINTDKDEIFPFIHSDGTLFFSSNGQSDALGGLDLYYSKPGSDDLYSTPRNLGSPFNSNSDDFGFILDLETKNGYFSSNRAGGKGQDDIYSFYVAQGLNKLLESREQELAKTPRPFKVFVADNATGDEVLGALVSFLDLDDMNLANVLTVTDESGNLIRIQALDPESNELTLTVDMAESEIKGFTNKEGLFESDVPPSTYVIAVNADGYFPKQVVIEGEDQPDEILVLLDPLGDVIPFSGTVLDPRFNTPIAGAKVTIVDDSTGATTTLYTDRNGNFNYYLPKDKDYTVTIEKDNLKTSRKVTTRNLESGSEIAMAFDINDPNGRNPFAQGNVINLPNIYYNFNDASIRPDAKPDLDALATILKQFPDVKIELASHTDSRGSESYNRTLSQRRADNALKYLTNKGVRRSRLKGVGYGENQLKNQCSDGVTCSDVDHQVNRRTEFRIAGDAGVTASYANNQPTIVDAGPKENLSTNATTNPTDQNVKQNETTGGNGNFVVIAGTFKVAQNAERRFAELKELGYNSAQIIPTTSSASAVKVGDYSSQDEAKEIAKTLESKHNISAYVKRM
ncbi:MAG: OmpA family protein [Saprospiraceae bacterium]|nr:OmpA family protein [Saprospiraceae bacterium]